MHTCVYVHVYISQIPPTTILLPSFGSASLRLVKTVFMEVWLNPVYAAST